MVFNEYCCVIGELGYFYFLSVDGDAFDVVVIFQSPRKKDWDEMVTANRRVSL